MENNSLLFKSEVNITDNIILKIPTVEEVLDKEGSYFSLVSFLTSSPFQYMVQLDDLGLDYSKVKPYEMFLIFAPVYMNSDTSILFKDLQTDDFDVYQDATNGTHILYSPKLDIKIDELGYVNISNMIRKINILEKDKRKAVNENAKEYLLDKERKRLKRLEHKQNKQTYNSEFEKLIVALVNQKDFKYNYEEIKKISIYQFYRSFKQIQTTITFNNTMRGVYAGTVDTSKLKDKSCLSWIPQK